MQQTGHIGREYSILQYVNLTLDVYQYCYDVGHCVKCELFFIKPGVKVNGQCCWDVRCYYLVICNNFVFQEVIHR